MNRRLIGGFMLLIILIFAILVFIYDQEFNKRETLMNPNQLSSYPENGYYKINSETILTVLEQDEPKVFTPLLEDPSLVEPVTNVSFSWTQADFLKVASALGQFTWKDPMDLKDWDIYFIILRGSCKGDPMGFDLAGITYYKPIEVDGKKVYTTRRIEIDLYYNTVWWGSGATYSQSILNRWPDVNLVDAKISADDALRIADKNGGKEVRLQIDNKCSLYASSPYFNHNDRWHISYFTNPSFEMYIDMNTGEYEVLNPDQ